MVANRLWPKAVRSRRIWAISWIAYARASSPTPTPSTATMAPWPATWATSHIGQDKPSGGRRSGIYDYARHQHGIHPLRGQELHGGRGTRCADRISVHRADGAQWTRVTQRGGLFSLRFDGRRRPLGEGHLRRKRSEMVRPVGGAAAYVG